MILYGFFLFCIDIVFFGRVLLINFLIDKDYDIKRLGD